MKKHIKQFTQLSSGGASDATGTALRSAPSAVKAGTRTALGWLIAGILEGITRMIVELLT